MSKQNKHKFAAVILAAGKGQRMCSTLPKVMHKLAGKPMLNHVLDSVSVLKPQKTVVVTAPHMDQVRDAAGNASIAIQKEQLGTGHAVKCALPMLKGIKGTTLVLFGDTPMISSASLAALLATLEKHKAAIALLGMKPESPMGYGRLVMKDAPFVDRIVECKDANAAEKKIPWVWGGVMAFDSAFLSKELSRLKPSPVTGEYYLTALIDAATKQGLKTVNVPVETEETMGINDRIQQAEAERAIQQKLRKKAMEQGATLIDPESVYFSADTKLGKDVIVQPNVVFGPGVTIGDGSEIRSFSHIEGAKIDRCVTIGPFARIRPGSHIEDGAHIGNFVELKATKLAKGAKVNHLSYVGDASVGAAANVGAGTITCNYDGFNKYKTTIGANAFIGSNSSLVAPVTIGDGAIIGAGSIITENVPADALAVARAPQVTKRGKAKEIKAEKKKAKK